MSQLDIAPPLLPPDTTEATFERIESRKGTDSKRVDLGNRLRDMIVPMSISVNFPNYFTSIFTNKKNDFMSQRTLMAGMHSSGYQRELAETAGLTGIIMNAPVKIGSDEGLYLSSRVDRSADEESQYPVVEVLKGSLQTDPYYVFTKYGTVEFSQPSWGVMIDIENDAHPTIEQVNDVDIIVSGFEKLYSEIAR